MDCNKKVKLVVSEFFWGWEGGSKLSLVSSPSWTQLHEIEHGGKTDLLIEKRKLSDVGWIISRPNAENCKSSSS